MFKKAIKINLASAQFRENAFEEFTKMREMGPLIRVQLSMMGKVWMTTTYEGANEVLRDHRRFVRNPANAGRRFYTGMQLMMPRMINTLSKNMLGADEPDHRRLRSLVEKAFVKANIDSLHDRLVVLANQQLDIAEQVARDNHGQFDFIEHFARPFPLTVICELLGLPDEDRVKFKKWFRAFTEISSVWQIYKILPGLKKCMKYFRQQFEDVRQNPRDDLITALVQAEESGDRLSDEELLSMAMLLLLAGHETTVHLIASAFLTLFELPKQRQALVQDWSTVDAVVEEVLRYGSAVQFTKPRFVAEDMEFCGEHLKRGELVIAGLAAGNYDPAAFEDPGEFRLHRKNKHLTFGLGPHVCLGLKLAKAETEVALQQTLTRWPELEPQFDPQHPDWSKRLGFRSLKTMIVKTS